MALNIQTFSNTSGGMALFKALGHPEAAPKGEALVARLADAGPVAVYDPGPYLYWCEAVIHRWPIFL